MYRYQRFICANRNDGSPTLQLQHTRFDDIYYNIGTIRYKLYIIHARAHLNKPGEFRSDLDLLQYYTYIMQQFSAVVARPKHSSLSIIQCLVCMQTLTSEYNNNTMHIDA